jgi:uncharacterized membrane protein YdjX (TVP38/TMEM64 family)
MPQPLLASKTVRWFIAAWLVALVCIYLFTDLRKFLTLDSVRDAQSWFMQTYDASPWLVALAFFGIFTLISVISMPGAAALMLIAGSSFGLICGTLLSTLASAVGATIAMLLTRYFFRDAVETSYRDRMIEIDRGIEKSGLYYLFSLRVAPVIPYFILNWLCGLTTMRVWPFFWVSFVGMLPGTAVYVNAGNEIAKIDSLGNIFSWHIIASMMLLALLPLVLKFVVERFDARRDSTATALPLK